MDENTTNESKMEIEPIPFSPIGDILVTTTELLGMKMNDIFASVFKDYYGCRLGVNYRPERYAYLVVPELIFQVLPDQMYGEDQRTAFVPLGSVNGNSMLNRIQRISQKGSSIAPKVEMNPKAQELLEDFMFTNKDKKVDWRNTFSTFQLNSGTFIKLEKIDPIKVLKKIYGSKDEYGSSLSYQIMPSWPLNPNQYKQPTNWAINIVRLYHDNEIAAAQAIGMNVQNEPELSIITRKS